MAMGSWDSIPIIDLAPFYREGDDEAGKRRVVEEISVACLEFGFFQVVNHGIPLDLIKQSLEVYHSFFDFSYEDKLKSSCVQHSMLGYFRSPDLTKEGNEHFLMFSPHSDLLNPYPKTLPRFQEVLEEMYPKFVKLASLTEDIINESLGLPENCLKEYNNGDHRTRDFLLGLHYFPATTEETENVGKSAHEDSNLITLLYQDDVGGLQVCKKNGEWIPVAPLEGAIIINVGDVLQVLSNGKFRSATHKVIRSKGKHRYSLAYFRNLDRKKLVEPLPQFTREIGELPKYRAFVLEDYLQLRIRDRTHPPERYEDLTRIARYAINN